MAMLVLRPSVREKLKTQQPKMNRLEGSHRFTSVPPASESEAAHQLPPELLAVAVVCLKRANSQFIRSLRCELVGETLEIRGSVPTYYQKQIAQELLRRELPDVRIKNCVCVD